MTGPLVRLVAATAVLTGAIAAAMAAPHNATSNPLRVSMYAADGSVEVIVTNTSRQVARVPKWQLPSSELQGNLFRISRDGQPVAYEGILAKRGLPQPSDFAILRPGQSYRTVVDLANAYDMSKPGRYTITLASPLQHASLSDGSMLKTDRGLPMLLQSAPLQVWNVGHPKQQAKKPGGGTVTVVNGVSFAGCSSTQIAQGGQAVVDARGYTQNSRNYLATGTVGPRYTTWFGSYTSARYGTANNPYEIFVCRAFWPAPARGTDSKAGTLIHEMSHFDVVASTSDWVYGQTAAKNLAATHPTNA